jgi:hypothetical protein
VVLAQVYAAVVARESVENEKTPSYIDAVIRDYGVSTTKKSRNFYVFIDDAVVVHQKKEIPFSGVQRLVVKFYNADSKRQLIDDLIKNKESVIIYGNTRDDFFNATKMLNKKTQELIYVDNYSHKIKELRRNFNLFCVLICGASLLNIRNARRKIRLVNEALKESNYVT